MWCGDADVWADAAAWMGMREEREDGVQVADEGGGVCGGGSGADAEERRGRSGGGGGDGARAGDLRGWAVFLPRMGSGQGPEDGGGTWK